MFGDRKSRSSYFYNNAEVNSLSTTLHGDAVVTGASNVEGAWVQLIAATASDVYGLVVTINRGASGAASREIIADFGIGAAGSEVPIISNLIGNSPTNSNFGFQNVRFFPIFIPKGTRIACRIQANTAMTLDVGLVLYGGFDQPPWPVFSGVETLGTITGSGFPGVTPGASGVFGSWTTIGTTTRPWGGFHVAMQGPGATAWTTQMGHCEIGYDSVALTTKPYALSTNEAVHQPHEMMPEMIPIPAGKIMQVRLKNNQGTAQNVPVALYGLY